MSWLSACYEVFILWGLSDLASLSWWVLYLLVSSFLYQRIKPVFQIEGTSVWIVACGFQICVTCICTILVQSGCTYLLHRWWSTTQSEETCLMKKILVGRVLLVVSSVPFFVGEAGAPPSPHNFEEHIYIVFFKVYFIWRVANQLQKLVWATFCCLKCNEKQRLSFP